MRALDEKGVDMKKLVLIVCAVALTMGLAACSCGQVSSSASSAGLASSASSSATSASRASASTTTSALSSSAETTGGPFENSTFENSKSASAAPANSASAETPVDPGLPAGEFGYVAPRGGYRGSITVNGDGTATIAYAFAMKPESHSTIYEVQLTGESSPAGGSLYSLVPISGDDTDVLSAYYDGSQDAIVVNEMVYVRV